jgi:hypothetical protein
VTFSFVDRARAPRCPAIAPFQALSAALSCPQFSADWCLKRCLDSILNKRRYREPIPVRFASRYHRGSWSAPSSPAIRSHADLKEEYAPNGTRLFCCF